MKGRKVWLYIVLAGWALVGCPLGLLAQQPTPTPALPPVRVVPVTATPPMAPPATQTPTATLVPPPTLPPTAPPTLAPVRLQFAPGTWHLSHSGQIGPWMSQDLVLRILGEQTLRVWLSTQPEAGAILTIAGADGDVLLSDHAGAMAWEGVVPRTQDYIVRVVGGSNPVTYRVDIEVPPLGSSSGSETATRITFPPGGIDATVAGMVMPQSSKLFVLRAMKDQTMFVELRHAAGDPLEALLVIWGADGDVLLSDHAGATSWEGVLPKTQDYFIKVYAYGSAPIPFILYVRIPPP